MTVIDGDTGGSAEGGEPACWIMVLTRRQAEYITDLLGMTGIFSLRELGLEPAYENMQAVFGVAVNGVGVDDGDVLVWNKGAERVVYGKDDDGE